MSQKRHELSLRLTVHTHLPGRFASSHYLARFNFPSLHFTRRRESVKRERERGIRVRKDAPEMVRSRELDSVSPDRTTDGIESDFGGKLKLTSHVTSSSSHRKRQFPFPLHCKSAAMHVASSQSYSSSLQAAKGTSCFAYPRLFVSIDCDTKMLSLSFYIKREASFYKKGIIGCDRLLIFSNFSSRISNGVTEC